MDAVDVRDSRFESLPGCRSAVPQPGKSAPEIFRAAFSKVPFEWKPVAQLLPTNPADSGE
jgi:hypothetical protein